MAPYKQCWVVYVYADLMWLHVFAEYKYMEDLLELDRRRRVPTPDVPPALTSNLSRLSAETWQLSLAEHPDTRLKEYVINGIWDGFQSGMITNTMPASVQSATCYQLWSTQGLSMPISQKSVLKEDYWAPLTQPHCHQSRLAGLG